MYILQSLTLLYYFFRRKTDKSYDLLKSCDYKLKGIETSVKNFAEELLSKVNEDIITNVTLGVKAAMSMLGLCFIVFYFIIVQILYLRALGRVWTV